MRIAMILAVDHSGSIGVGGELPWRLGSDLRRFRRLTIGSGRNAVVMGRRTWESLPEKYRPLRERQNVVLTRQEGYEAPGCWVMGSWPAARQRLASEGFEITWIIGGGQLYNDLRGDVDEVHLTEVDATSSGAVTVDPFEPDAWERKVMERLEASESDEHATTYLILRPKATMDTTNS